MLKIRPARIDDIASLKEIWKLSFGDKEKFIDFFYANRFKKEETLLLQTNQNISAMLTLMPVRIVTPDFRSVDSVMLYAMATHPAYRNKGFASRIMEFSDRYLKLKDKAFSVLVPQGQSLFDFYRRRGYQEAFYIREACFSYEMIENMAIDQSVACTVNPGNPEEYNEFRNHCLQGNLYIAYSNEDIFYQKRLSGWSGADIYLAKMGDIQGGAVVEKVSPDRILIKELLAPEEYIPDFIRHLSRLLPAKEYLVRTPAFLGQNLGGAIRSFGMVKMHKDMDVEICKEGLGYMGLAFD
ncbi:MAG: GNAT family N-acetyltransferase [Peptococcaceae bacterium]|nr:GNAT family N-acetyltransferase [Peptococcaceae bacterium]